MRKLIEKYRANPTYKMAQKIRAYDRAHMMSTSLLTEDERAIWATAIHHANKGAR